jgi:hypothetical protein
MKTNHLSYLGLANARFGGADVVEQRERALIDDIRLEFLD